MQVRELKEISTSWRVTGRREGLPAAGPRFDPPPANHQVAGLCYASAFASALSHVFGTLRFGDSEWSRPILLIGLPAACLLLLLNPNKTRAAMTGKSGLAVGLLILLNAFSHIIKTDLFPTDGGFLDPLFTPLTLAGMYLSFLVGSVCAGDKRLWRAVAHGMLVGGAIHAFAVLVLPNVMEHQNASRKLGLLFDPNFAVVYIVLPFCVALGLCARRKWRAPVLVVGVVSIIAVLKTVSKMGLGLMAALIALVILVALARSNHGRRLSRVVAILAAPMILFFVDSYVYPVITDVRSQYEGRFRAGSKHSMLDERLHWLSEVANQNWTSHERMFGTGYVNSSNVPHNTFADQYFGTGVPGLAIFTGLILASLIRQSQSINRCRSSGEWWEQLAGVMSVGALFLTFMALSLLTTKLVWLLVGLSTVSTVRRKQVFVPLQNLVKGAMRA